MDMFARLHELVGDREALEAIERCDFFAIANGLESVSNTTPGLGSEAIIKHAASACPGITMVCFYPCQPGFETFIQLLKHMRNLENVDINYPAPNGMGFLDDKRFKMIVDAIVASPSRIKRFEMYNQNRLGEAAAKYMVSKFANRGFEWIDLPFSFTAKARRIIEKGTNYSTHGKVSVGF
jgi:hypothetical protein